MRKILLFAALGALLSTGASAQQSAADYRQRLVDLVALSSIFGELHHIRRNCEPRYEADAWRERMKKLVDLEEPQATSRNDMVSAFNKAYQRAGARFPTCDRRARDYAATRAAQGDALIERLTEPLYEAMKEGVILAPYVPSSDAPATETQDSN